MVSFFFFFSVRVGRCGGCGGESEVQGVGVDALEIGAQEGEDRQRGGLVEEGEVACEEEVEGEEVGEG